jgi:acyl-CoA thioesterase-1
LLAVQSVHLSSTFLSNFGATLFLYYAEVQTASSEQLQQNLAAMIQQSQKAGAKVLLLGMRIPPNCGVRYTTAFEAVYSYLAEQENVPLVPFFIEGVGGIPELMQAEGLHPAAATQDKLLENV